MSDLEHESAIYFDEDFARHEIKASALVNTEVLASAKGKVLWDKSEQKRLQARGGPSVTPHFAELPGEKTTRKVFEGEKDKTHNERVSFLMERLVESERLDLVLAHQAVEGIEEIDTLYCLPRYQWQAEVHRIMDAQSLVRHDIYGQSSALSMSVNRPWIAIEVINTHYPDDQAFSAILNASRCYPLIALFDFTSNPNTFVKVDVANKHLRIRPWSFYIKDGQLWKGKRPTNILTSTHFKLEVDKMLAGWKKKRQAG